MAGVGRDLMDCIISTCRRVIPAARLEAQPRAITCSSACSRTRALEMNAARNRRSRARKRARLESES